MSESKMYTAEVVADSISPDDYRITSVKVVYPHAVHKDMLRHRAHNRNVESFRAQPPEKLIENLRNGGAFKPEVFAKRTKGMGQHYEAIDEAERASSLWDDHVRVTTGIASIYLDMGIAKQQVNFLLQDLCPLTEIITATDWDNFFALRTELNEDGTPVARPEVYKTAKAIQEAISASVPQKLDYGQIHLPFVTEHELQALCKMRSSNLSELELQATEDHWIGVSAGRCARISFGDYEWWNESLDVSYTRSRRLLGSGHMSPFEQQAKPFSKCRWNLVERLQYSVDKAEAMDNIERDEITRQLEYSGNLRGWVPVRKTFPGEYDYAELRKQQL